MMPSPSGVVFTLVLILMTLGLLAVFFIKIRDERYRKVFIAALLCGLVGFVSITILLQRFSAIFSLVFGFFLGFTAGSAWAAAVQAVVSAVYRIKRSRYLSDDDIWWSGVLPSSAFLGYLITSTMNQPFRPLTLFVVLFSGPLLVIMAKISGRRFINKSGKAAPLRLVSSPILWVSLATILIFVSVGFWFE